MDAGGFARTYGVELLCEGPPAIARADLLAALRVRCPGVRPLDGNPTRGLLSFVHEDHPIRVKGGPNAGPLAAQTFIAVADRPPDAGALEPALQQTWSFPGARQAVAGATATVLVTDLMSSGLEYRKRLDLFQRALLGVLSVVPCRAIHWQPTQRLVDPVAFLSAANGDPGRLFCTGALNVRLFNIQNSPGEAVIDTLGLAALGLPDLQCHFRALDTDRLASLLFNTGWYLFEHGDVIEDDHTIAGIEPGSRWRCRHETSLVPPEREVLDLDPGVPFAAGSRS